MSANPESATNPAALAGLKVLDLSRFIAGPYCGLMLGDLGADVVKVESVGKGDNTRSFIPRFGDESLYTIAMNRNERSIELNFRDPEGQAILRRLMSLGGLTPYEYICKAWTSEPERFILDPIHQMPELNT